MFYTTFYFHSLQWLWLLQLLQARGSFGLGYKVNVLDAAIFEWNGPIGVVVSHGRGDQKTFGKFGVDHHVFAGVQLFSVGLLGVYVSNILVQVQNRPDFVVQSKIVEDGKEFLIMYCQNPAK